MIESKAGFGLVQVSVYLLIGTLILAPLTWVISTKIRAQRETEFTDAYKQIESYLLDSFAYRVETFFSALGSATPSNCANAGALFNAAGSPLLPVVSVAGGFEMRRLVTSTLPAITDPLFVAGVQRCNSQTDLGPTASLQNMQTVFRRKTSSRGSLAILLIRQLRIVLVKQSKTKDGGFLGSVAVWPH